MTKKMLTLRGLLVIPLLLLPACSAGPKPTPLEAAKSAFDELRSAVRKKIKDPAKAGEVVVLVDQLEQIMIEAGDARKVHAVRIRALNAKYDATEEEFRTLFADYNGKQKERQERLLVIDQQARELTTEQEWKALAKGVAKALDASARAELGL